MLNSDKMSSMLTIFLEKVSVCNSNMLTLWLNKYLQRLLSNYGYKLRTCT